MDEKDHGKKNDKRGKRETHMVGPGIWQETLKNVKNVKYTSSIWVLAKNNLKNVENETQTLFNLEYGEKHSKMWKMRNAHCRTWKMARNSEKHEK